MSTPDQNSLFVQIIENYNSKEKIQLENYFQNLHITTHDKKDKKKINKNKQKNAYKMKLFIKKIIMHGIKRGVFILQVDLSFYGYDSKIFIEENCIQDEKTTLYL